MLIVIKFISLMHFQQILPPITFHVRIVERGGLVTALVLANYQIGNFSGEIGKNSYFCHWEHNPILAIKMSEKNPALIQHC